MNEIRFDDIAGIKARVSEEYGPWSAPLSVTQELITGFAELTGDRQWIHVDIERAKSESPLGSTITHGFLILSLIPELRKTEGYKIVGYANALNYGIDRLRFIRPAPVNSSIHCRSRFEGVEVKNGGTMIQLGVAIHVVGEDVPCAAFSWKLFYRP